MYCVLCGWWREGDGNSVVEEVGVCVVMVGWSDVVEMFESGGWCGGGVKVLKNIFEEFKILHR